MGGGEILTHRGYGLEHETEIYFLDLNGQTNKDPIIGQTGSIGRTFRVPASGALAALKGDVRTAIPWLKKQIMVECKDKRKKSADGSQFYRLKMDIVQKNIEEAQAANMIPVFLFAYKGAMFNRKQVVMRKKDLEELLENFDDLGPVQADVERIQFKAQLLKMNKMSYTVFKKDIDVSAENFLTFTHENSMYIIFSWKIFDTIMRGIKACNTPTLEQRRISSDMHS
jgi:hypothetical protein